MASAAGGRTTTGSSWGAYVTFRRRASCAISSSAAPVRYVIIHYDRIPQPRRRHLEAEMFRYREKMPVRIRIGNDVVYEIVDGS